jgi:hypothetical protein
MRGLLLGNAAALVQAKPDAELEPDTKPHREFEAGGARYGV